jgi:hypothetical protein
LALAWGAIKALRVHRRNRPASRPFEGAMPSTAIRALSYDEVTRTLFVTFVDGDTYAYFEASPALYRDFRAARSKGGFFARRVRGLYRYRRLEGPGDQPEPSPVRGSGGPASPPPAAARH